MDEIEKRLRETTDACIKSYESWIQANKSLEAREDLMETMHEVRKVVARLEIEIAISERERLGSRPIPIPPHRSQRKRGDGGEDAGEDFNYDDQQPPMMQGGGGSSGGHDRNRPPHQQNRNRRPMHRNHGGGTQGGGGNGGNGNGGGNGNSES